MNFVHISESRINVRRCLGQGRKTAIVKSSSFVGLQGKCRFLVFLGEKYGNWNQSYDTRISVNIVMLTLAIKFQLRKIKALGSTFAPIRQIQSPTSSFISLVKDERVARSMLITRLRNFFVDFTKDNIIFHHLFGKGKRLFLQESVQI